MGTNTQSVQELIRDFRITGVAMRYSLFVPRLYNLVKTLGFTPGKIMPARAFCSDETQGYPIILLTKHFGTFPFNHGHLGGVVATDRQAPHAHHGKDLVIVQASHVGYDPVRQVFGEYRRLQTENNHWSANCGKICGCLDWYLDAYRFAGRHILLSREEEVPLVTIDNQLLDEERSSGLFIDLDRLLQRDGDGGFELRRTQSTARVYRAAEEFVARVGEAAWGDEAQPLGERLEPELFHFRRQLDPALEGPDHLEHNLLPSMPHIVASREPALLGAMINTQVEFDRAYRSIRDSAVERERRVFFIAGVNIDISPADGQLFPLTKFVPWAAYLQEGEGSRRLWEQNELHELLNSQSVDNDDQIDIEMAIRAMHDAPEVRLNWER